MIDKIKELRIKIDGLSQLVKKVIEIEKSEGGNHYSHELSKSFDSLLLAKAWLGKILEVISPKFALRQFEKVDNDKKPRIALGIIKYSNNEEELIEEAIKLESEHYSHSVELNTPYKKDGNRKSVAAIEPTADSSKVIESLNKYPEITNTFEGLNWKEATHIEKVDKLRTEIKKIITTTSDFSENCDYIELEQGFVYKYLCEARFYLGFELSRIKNEN